MARPQSAAKNRLVIRGAVLARVDNLPLFHGGAGSVEIPVFGLRAGECHRPQPTNADDGVHGGGRNEVDILDRLLQNDNVAVQFGGHSGPFGYDQIAATVDGDKAVPARAFVHRKLLRIIERVAAFYRKCVGLCRFRCRRTACQQQGGQGQK